MRFVNYIRLKGRLLTSQRINNSIQFRPNQQCVPLLEQSMTRYHKMTDLESCNEQLCEILHRNKDIIESDKFRELCQTKKIDSLLDPRGGCPLDPYTYP